MAPRKKKVVASEEATATKVVAETSGGMTGESSGASASREARGSRSSRESGASSESITSSASSE